MFAYCAREKFVHAFFAMLVFRRNGGQGRNRTADAGLFRAALYQLSYLARLVKKTGKYRDGEKELSTWRACGPTLPTL
jgi:hypothetical protein